MGNSKWGVRLNEVAYGSGVDYRRRGAASKPMGNAWVGGLMDDGPAIAEILQEEDERGHASNIHCIMIIYILLILYIYIIDIDL